MQKPQLRGKEGGPCEPCNPPRAGSTVTPHPESTQENQGRRGTQVSSSTDKASRCPAEDRHGLQPGSAQSARYGASTGRRLQHCTQQEATMQLVGNWGEVETLLGPLAFTEGWLGLGTGEAESSRRSAGTQ